MIPTVSLAVRDEMDARRATPLRYVDQKLRDNPLACIDAGFVGGIALQRSLRRPTLKGHRAPNSGIKPDPAIRSVQAASTSHALNRALL